MIEVRIPDSAFAPGGPLEGSPRNRTKVVVKQSSPDGTQKYPLVVDVNGITLPDIVFDSSFYGERIMLCDMVEKGVLIVKHNGVPLTPVQIRDFSAT